MRTRRSGRSAIKLAALPIVAAVIAAACGGGSSSEQSGDSTGGGGDKTATASDTASEGGDKTGGGGDTAESTGGTDSETEGVSVTIAPSTDMEPVDGGILRYGVEAEVGGLNPAVSAMTAASGLVMASAVFDTLAEYSTDGTPVPYLAESFTPNDDFSEWDIKLRPDVMFHDGTPLDAEAVVVNFNAQRENFLVGNAVKPFFADTDPFTVVDPLTVHVKLSDPNALWPSMVTGQLGMMASPAWLEAAEADPTLNQMPVGTGPFKIESRNIDSITKFVRNDDWWNGRVYLDGVDVIVQPDYTTRNDLLFGGEIDAEHTTDPASILDLRDEGSIQLVESDAGSESFLMMNTKAPPFDDIRARQALAYATPRQDYESLYGLDVTRMADQRYTPDSPYYNPDVKQVGDDPAKAAELVAEYCAERGTETNPITEQPTCTDGAINIEYQWASGAVTNERIASTFTDSWQAAGFNVTADPQKQGDHILQVATGKYNAVTWRQFGAVNPTVDNVWVMCRTIGEDFSLNFPMYCNEELDANLLAASASDDQATRVSNLQAAEQQINEQFTYVFLIHTLWGFGFADNVHGVCDRTSPEGVPLVCSIDGRTWHSSVWIES